MDLRTMGVQFDYNAGVLWRVHDKAGVGEATVSVITGIVELTSACTTVKLREEGQNGDGILSGILDLVNGCMKRAPEKVRNGHG